MKAASEIRGHVDFGILTIREDEYKAVLSHFKIRETVKGRGYYEYCEVKTVSGGSAKVAVARCLEQGHNNAQSATRDMIDDIDPAWILLVGIAGGFPEDGYSLGDVVLANRIYDLSVSAEILNEDVQEREWNLMGGPVHPQIAPMLAAMTAWKDKFKGWNTQKTIQKKKPSCEVPTDIVSDRLLGGDDHRKKVMASLARHFPSGRKKMRPPLFSVIPVASGNILVKDPAVLEEWKKLARSCGFVEMEAGGVYQGAQRPHRIYPVLVIRGLSDIVGFKRGAEWTEYACYTAAAFAAALIREGVCDLTRTVDGQLPGTQTTSANPSPTNGSEEQKLEEEMAKLTFAELQIVTQYLLAQPSAPGTDFTVTDPAQKMVKNRLGNSTSKQLIIGLNQANLVRDYLEQMGKFDSDFVSRLKGGFLAAYGKFKQQKLDGDELFNSLADFASASSDQWPNRAAGLAILTHLFEICEVFDK